MTLECSCHRESGSHEACCGHDQGRDPDCPFHGDGSGPNAIHTPITQSLDAAKAERERLLQHDREQQWRQSHGV